ncbi:MAG TPA: ABC transporter permease [Candidatus Dormibacteraeota bacterium]
MRHIRDLLGVATAGLFARKARTALIVAGPLLGVAALMGVIGLTDSAKGDVQTTLQSLGTNLLVVNASGQSQKLPSASLDRVRHVKTVTSVAGATSLSNITVSDTDTVRSEEQAAATQIRAVDPSLPSVVGARMRWGRFLNSWDNDSGDRAVVIGANLAQVYGLVPGEVRTILLNGRPYAVVGVLQPVPLLSDLDNSVLITRTAAVNDWSDDGTPSTLYVRVVEGTTQATASILPTAVTYGGPGNPIVSVPSDLLSASAKVDATLRNTGLAMAALALLVGGLGIANVMSISVIQRQAEIGIRRAVGHSRFLIGAQFFAEALFVGVIGGVLGILSGAGFVAAVALDRNWVLVIEPWVPAAGLAVAVSVAVIAGIYPAMKAARLEPLATLRLG